jgi:hypothetical protein
MIIDYQSSIINKKAKAYLEQHNNLATLRILGYIIASFELTQFYTP